MEIEAYILLAHNPTTGDPILLATARTEEGAWKIAEETADAILMSYQYSRLKDREFALELTANARVVPARVIIDDSYFPEA